LFLIYNLAYYYIRYNILLYHYIRYYRLVSG